MGRGHSGSTILDLLLGSAPGVVSVGELLSGMGRLGGKCSCGESIGSCRFWTQVRERTTEQLSVNDGEWDRLVAVSHRFGHVFRLPMLLLQRKNKRSTALAEFGRQQLALFRAIAHTSGVEAVVDSSKEVTRALALATTLDGVRVLHLVRNVESILASNLWRMRNGEPFRFLRRDHHPKRVFFPYLLLSTAAWVIGNAMAEIVRMCNRGRVLRVRYEDLCRDPAAELARIGDFVRVDMTRVIEDVEKGREVPVGHLIAGNRIRMRSTFRFAPQSAGRPLPPIYRWLARILAAPMLWKYGFLFGGRCE